MTRRKRKLTAAEKKEKAKYMTVFLHGKQKKVLRPVLIDGIDPDDFILRNADPIWLHQNGMWEYIAEAERLDGGPFDADHIPF